MITTKKLDKFISYVGYTNNLKRRLNAHNNGKGAKFTRGNKWKLIYYEIFSNKTNALKREYSLKKDRKLRNYIKKITIKK
tara:strand:- start:533 stop:772 length:240 start_codon:yes stop_codon:yes gene_type:complete